MERFLRKALAVVACVGLVGSASAAGFAIIEQTTRSMGRALGGVTADTRDINALYFNPSIPGWFDKDEVSVGIHFLKIQINYSDKGSTSTLGSEEGNDIGGWSNIPNIVYVHPLADDLSVGFSLSGTSGTKTDYNNYWVGRYTATLTDIAVMDFNPVIAWRPISNLSIGVGLAVEYAMIEQEQRLDFREYNAMSGALSAIPSWDGPSHVSDGKIKMEGDSVAVGFTAGISYKPTEKTTLGMGFRSRMRHHVKDMKVRSQRTKEMKEFLGAHYPLNPAYTMMQVGGLTDFRTSGKADTYLHLPASLSIGILHELTDAWRVGLDIAWSEQHVMEDLRAEFHDPMYGTVTSQRLMMCWEDNWRVALGTEYDVTEKLTVRTGFAWDQTPVQDEYRTTKMPDSDRYWIAFGLGYQFTEHLRADFAWTHIFYQSNSTHQVSGTNGITGEVETIHGKYGAHSDTFSLALNYCF